MKARTRRCSDPVGAKIRSERRGGAPTGSRSASLRAALSASLLVLVRLLMVQGARVYLDQPQIVFLCGLHDSLPGCPLALKAATNEPSGRRRITMSGSDSSIVVELGEEQFILTHNPANASRGGSATVYDQPLLSLSQGYIFCTHVSRWVPYPAIQRCLETFRTKVGAVRTHQPGDLAPPFPFP